MCQLVNKKCSISFDARCNHEVYWGRMYFQHDGAPPYFHVKLQISWTLVSLGDGSDVAVPIIGQPGLQTYAHWTIVYGDGWKNWFTGWGWEREMHCFFVFWMPQTASETGNGSCNEQLAQFTVEQQTVLRPAVAFNKTSFKHRKIQIKGNFTKVTLHLYFKCIMFYAGLLFCSVYCQ